MSNILQGVLTIAEQNIKTLERLVIPLPMPGDFTAVKGLIWLQQEQKKPQ